MIELNTIETRIIGALMEKEVTTPEQYPLTLNALIAACNQKSSRDPVMSLSETEVKQHVDTLVDRGLVAEMVFGGRVPKYRQRFCNTEFSQLHFGSKELACICVMLLRGPQTPGELKARTGRMCEFTDTTDVENTLSKLSSKEGGPYVQRLERQPGRRESRYCQLFSPSEYDQAVNQQFDATSQKNEPQVIETSESKHNLEIRVTELEEQLATLRKDFLALKQQWDDFVEN